MRALRENPSDNVAIMTHEELAQTRAFDRIKRNTLDAFRKIQRQVEACQTAKEISSCGVAGALIEAALAFASEIEISHNNGACPAGRAPVPLQAIMLAQLLAQEFTETHDNMSVTKEEYDS